MKKMALPSANLLPAFLAGMALSCSAFSAEGMLHPLCFAQLVSPDGQAGSSVIDVKHCNARYKDFPFSHDGWQASWKRQASTKEKPATPLKDMPDFAAYQVIGGLENGQALIQYEINYGGSGVFTYGLVVDGFSLTRNSTDNVQVEGMRVIAGGDRCMGGIEKVSIIAPNEFQITRQVTPAGLLSYSGKQTDAVKALIDKLPDCATCCIGTIKQLWYLDGVSEVTAAVLNPAESFPEGSKEASCLYHLLPEAEDASLELDHEDLKSLQYDFVRSCEGLK